MLELYWGKKSMLRRAQLAINPLPKALAQVNRVSTPQDDLHDTVKKSSRQGDLCCDRYIELPDQWQGHDQHDDSRNDVWNRYEPCKCELVNASAAGDCFIPSISNWRA